MGQGRKKHSSNKQIVLQVWWLWIEGHNSSTQEIRLHFSITHFLFNPHSTEFPFFFPQNYRAPGHWSGSAILVFCYYLPSLIKAQMFFYHLLFPAVHSIKVHLVQPLPYPSPVPGNSALPHCAGHVLLPHQAGPPQLWSCVRPCGYPQQAGQRKLMTKTHDPVVYSLSSSHFPGTLEWNEYGGPSKINSFRFTPGLQ